LIIYAITNNIITMESIRTSPQYMTYLGCNYFDETLCPFVALNKSG